MGQKVQGKEFEDGGREHHHYFVVFIKICGKITLLGAGKEHPYIKVTRKPV
jgi:hypothetical protein